MAREIIVKSQYPKKPWKGSRVEVRMPGRKHPLQITIFCHEEYQKEGKMKHRQMIMHYEVNWSALGSLTPDLAVKYATAILVAAQEAARLTKLYHGTESKW